MAKRNSADTARTLASRWSAPLEAPGSNAGRPLVCVASTYTFHASFFETELLPRFLGLRFDETEGIRPFVIEREQALATARVCVLVDADHLDPSQSTLRWDQLPVRVPRGVGTRAPSSKERVASTGFGARPRWRADRSWCTSRSSREAPTRRCSGSFGIESAGSRSSWVKSSSRPTRRPPRSWRTGCHYPMSWRPS